MVSVKCQQLRAAKGLGYLSLLLLSPLAIALQPSPSHAVPLGCFVDCDESIESAASSHISPLNRSHRPMYVVQEGDTIETIAERYGLSVAALERVNEDQDLNALSPEQEVNLPWVPNVLAHPDFATGADNGMRISALIMLSPDAPAEFEWPLAGVITSRYGWRWGRMHRGLDIACRSGDPIGAAMEGDVIFAGWDRGGYGNRVDVRHANGWVTRYAHGSRVTVSEGDRVDVHQQVLACGSTGRSTGPHLHFEIRRGTQALNPMTLLGTPPTPGTNVVTVAAVAPLNGGSERLDLFDLLAPQPVTEGPVVESVGSPMVGLDAIAGSTDEVILPFEVYQETALADEDLPISELTTDTQFDVEFTFERLDTEPLETAPLSLSDS